MRAQRSHHVCNHTLCVSRRTTYLSADTYRVRLYASPLNHKELTFKASGASLRTRQRRSDAPPGAKFFFANQHSWLQLSA